jgi:hypothetical protein
VEQPFVYSAASDTCLMVAPENPSFRNISAAELRILSFVISDLPIWVTKEQHFRIKEMKFTKKLPKRVKTLIIRAPQPAS